MACVLRVKSRLGADTLTSQILYSTTAVDFFAGVGKQLRVKHAGTTFAETALLTKRKFI
jgi:hypothetical protein